MLQQCEDAIHEIIAFVVVRLGGILLLQAIGESD